VLGRSGTGKSVLLKLIIGLENSDAGSICIQGQEIAGIGLNEMNRLRIKMGFLFQHAALYDSLTVEQNVAFPFERHTKMPASELSDRVKELLRSVGMEHDLNKMPSDISGGMQKRVGLARALALQPEILLLDEPTAGLDPITSGEIDDLVLKLQKEHALTSIVVTHDLHSARAIADRVALLDKGNVVMEGSFEELSESNDDFVREFFKRDSQGVNYVKSSATGSFYYHSTDHPGIRNLHHRRKAVYVYADVSAECTVQQRRGLGFGGRRSCGRRAQWVRPQCGVAR
jgi:phospholipid/cholesterol/gamma-HCH transport system ATP-binding protein